MMPDLRANICSIGHGGPRPLSGDKRKFPTIFPYREMFRLFPIFGSLIQEPKREKLGHPPLAIRPLLRFHAFLKYFLEIGI